jgi:predicted transcriptional regulator
LSKYPTELKRLRIEVLKLSQEGIAKRTSLTTYTYRRAEDGHPIKYSSAQEITEAINSLLTEQGLQRVDLHDLGLTLE